MLYTVCFPNAIYPNPVFEAPQRRLSTCQKKDYTVDEKKMEEDGRYAVIKDRLRAWQHLLP